MLVEETLFGIRDKVNDAIEMLQDLEPDEGYYLAFSGGKDSVVIKELANMAGVKYDAHYNLTTIDPPEAVQFIKEYHSDVIWDKPKIPMLARMIEKQMPPSRIQRWCCREYKEGGGDGRCVITGVRAAESSKRAKRKPIELCYRGTGKRYLNLILHWSDDDVWNFIRENQLPYCKLYDQGWERIGCLFCPMAGPRRLKEAKLYPKYKKLFIRTFQKIIDARIAKGKKATWQDGEAFFDWWITDDRSHEDPDQQVMFE